MAFDFHKAAVDDAVEAETEALQSALRAANNRIVELEREREEACNRAEELDRNSVDDRLYEDLRAKLTAANERIAELERLLCEARERQCQIRDDGWDIRDRLRAQLTAANDRADQLAIERDQWAQAIRSVASGCIPSPVAAETAIRELKEMHDKKSSQLTAAQEELRAAKEDVQKERIEGGGRVFREERENES